MINKRSFVRRTSVFTHTSSSRGVKFYSASSSKFNKPKSSPNGTKSVRKFGDRKLALSGGSRSRSNKNFRFRNKNGGNRKRFSGERIDFSRFIKKSQYIEEKPYVAKHTFLDFSFDPQIHKNIARIGFINPRPIQDRAISFVLQGKDVFGMANTGTGKTAAFLLPLIEKIVKTKGKNTREIVLIMAPTRELALQIESDFRMLGFGLGIFSVACVGGLPITRQINEIKKEINKI